MPCRRGDCDPAALKGSESIDGEQHIATVLPDRRMGIINFRAGKERQFVNSSIRQF